MSERNGDRARFQKNRKRKLNQRERTRDLLATRGVAAAAKLAGDGSATSEAASGTPAPHGGDAATAGAAE